ncbi:MAG TPA: hypothetical protein VN875_01605 [Candidatus Binatus sp.]|nr:hypothetical protein [Candidatus Binatus sp.]
MRKVGYISPALLIFAAVLASLFPTHAQDQASSSNVQVTTVVTALGPKYSAPPALGKQDINVTEGKQKREVTSWVPAQGDKAALQLAIVIDDADSQDLATQLGDLKNFISSQPAGTAIGVFYASNGTVQPASQFSTDHEAVAKSVRIPLGYTGAYSSIYLSVMSLMKGWPVTGGARREILLIADGIDRFRGDYPISPDVDSTIINAQRAGIMIHTLFASGVGRATRNSFRLNLGQSNLAKIADATGGEAFFQGFFTPVSYAPFLQQLDMVLKNQYWLSWATERVKKPKGELRGFKVRTEQRGVDISAADKVFVPAP